MSISRSLIFVTGVEWMLNTPGLWFVAEIMLAYVILCQWQDLASLTYCVGHDCDSLGQENEEDRSQEPLGH